MFCHICGLTDNAVFRYSFIMTIEQQLIQAKVASRQLRTASTKQKNLFLQKLAELLITNMEQILAENKKDLDNASNLTPAMQKRLVLDEVAIKNIAKGVLEIINLPDPIGAITQMSRRPNGMQVGKKRVPIGVIFFIFESRPNVIVDAAALCVKSGNALVARGGKEAIYSNSIFCQLIGQALEQVGLSKFCVQQLEDRSHEAIYQVVKMDQYVDLAVPRGREALIRSVKENATVPVLAHERGLTHIYVDENANLEQAIKIIVNAKVSNPAVCNALEKALIHKNAASRLVPTLVDALLAKGVEVRGCEKICAIDSRCKLATAEDWQTEYLGLVITLKVVENYEEALEHIEKYSSGLADAIITNNYERAQNFLEAVNSANVLVNASIRLIDGNQFGLGAELGISTSSIHMRGPMGLEDLTVTKYIVLGNGQIRE